MYFTDTEYRIVLAMLAREKKICEKADKEYVNAEISLSEVIRKIERKIHDLQYGDINEDNK